MEKEISVVAAVVKKSEQSMAIPEWSVDTRGDLPIDKALGREEIHSASVNSLSNNYQANEKIQLESKNPCWPEETKAVNSSSDWCNSQELPPLTRRPGRDAMPRGDRNDRRKNYSGPASSINNNNGNGQSNGEGARRNDRKFMDDISTLKLPGVDLSKMPSASTRLAFNNSRENNNNNNSGNDRRRGSEFGTVSEEDRDRADVSERVERVAREMEELGWGEAEAIVEPNRSEHVNSEPVYSDSSRVESVRYEPSVIEGVRETVIRTQKDPNVEKKQQNYPNNIQTKVTNFAARLEDQGWGDEEEVVYCAPQSIEVDVPVKVEESEASSSSKGEKSKASSSVNATAENIVDNAVLVANSVNKPPIANETSPPVHAQHQIYQQMVMSPMPQNQMSPMPQHHPYMMNPNPLSPVGQMPMAPMSVMPGMMMPIWVTCPFCYHCYMYPPVAPISPQQQVQNNN